MDYSQLLLWGVTGGAALLSWKFYRSYNSVVALDERCKTAYSDIDVMLKHRHSMMPGLLDSLKGFINYEKDMLQRVLDSRQEALTAASAEIRLEKEAKFSNNVMQLLSNIEHHPQLKANSHFARFRDEFVDLENRITASRRFYNLTVAELNASVRQFPGNLVAKKQGVFTRNQYDAGAERIILEEPVSMKF